MWTERGLSGMAQQLRVWTDKSGRYLQTYVFLGFWRISQEPTSSTKLDHRSSLVLWDESIFVMFLRIPDLTQNLALGKLKISFTHCQTCMHCSLFLSIRDAIWTFSIYEMKTVLYIRHIILMVSIIMFLRLEQEVSSKLVLQIATFFPIFCFLCADLLPKQHRLYLLTCAHS